jgi:phosphoribosylpyrophosphate synthetase
MSTHTLQIFTGSSHMSLAREITKILGAPLGKSTTKVFDVSELYVNNKE